MARKTHIFAENVSHLKPPSSEVHVTFLSACQTKQGTLFTDWEVRNISRSIVTTIFFNHRFRDDSADLRMPLLETKLSMLPPPETRLRSGLLNRHSLSSISETLVLGVWVI